MFYKCNVCYQSLLVYQCDLLLAYQCVQKNFFFFLLSKTFDLYKHLLQTTQTGPILIALRNLSIELSSALDFECFTLSELLLFFIGLNVDNYISILGLDADEDFPKTVSSRI